MNKKKPLPTKINSLSRIKNEIDISSIVDVGIQKKTGELIEVFPELHHYLFEPVSKFYDDINKNYSKLKYSLYKLALSDVSETNYLVISSLEKNGKPTHSHISPDPIVVDGKQYLSSDTIDVTRFDHLELSQIIAPNFLLKVDVDGKDLNVLLGFGDKLKLASVIVVECTMITLTDRITYLEKNGFTLIDLVDLVYYGDSMYQLDAILVRKELLNENLKPIITNFKREIWYPLQLNLQE